MNLLLLVLILPTLDGFAPNTNTVGCSSRHHFVSSESGSICSTTGVSLQLFGTRKRIQRVYRSIRKRFQRKGEQVPRIDHDFSPVLEKTLVEEQRPTPVAAPQERKSQALAFAVGDAGESKFAKLLGNDTLVSFGGAVATLSALSVLQINDTTTLVDIPLTLEQAIGEHEADESLSGGHPVPHESHVVNRGDSSNGAPRNGRIALAKESPPTKNVESITNHRHLASGDTDIPSSVAMEIEQEVEDGVNNSVMVVAIPDEIPPLKSLYTLPPLDRDNLTKLEAEFRDMLYYFTQFTEADLYTIRDPRIRAIMEGVVSGSNEAPVYRAFEVLFEDLPPLRLAGRMIYQQLKNVMLKAQARAEAEVQAIVQSTGVSRERVQASRLAFLTLALPTEQGHEKEAHLTLDQLIDSGFVGKFMLALDWDNWTQFLANVDPRQSGKVTFPELMRGLQKTAEDACAVERCDPALVLQAVVKEMEPTLGRTTIRQSDPKRQEFSDRYDAMVAAFQEWDDIVPEGEGRRLDVLRGCFVGAANHRVVEALRVVYMDYAALRLAGNSIFAIMKTLVGTIRRRNANL